MKLFTTSNNTFILLEKYQYKEVEISKYQDFIDEFNAIVEAEKII